MKSFLPPNCLKERMCLLHLQKAKMNTVHYVRAMVHFFHSARKFSKI